MAKIKDLLAKNNIENVSHHTWNSIDKSYQIIGLFDSSILEGKICCRGGLHNENLETYKICTADIAHEILFRFAFPDKQPNFLERKFRYEKDNIPRCRTFLIENKLSTMPTTKIIQKTIEALLKFKEEEFETSQYPNSEEHLPKLIQSIANIKIKPYITFSKLFIDTDGYPINKKIFKINELGIIVTVEEVHHKQWDFFVSEVEQQIAI